MDPVFCPDDLVVKKSNETCLGVVERTHDDVDTHEPHPGRDERINRDKDITKASFNKFLKDGVVPDGTVLVRWQDSLEPHLIRTSKLNLLDRSLLIGDVVKKNHRDALSGIIVNTFTRCTLQPVKDITIRETGPAVKLKGIPPSNSRSQDRGSCIHNVLASELMYEESPAADDLIVYNDWIGRVDTVNYVITIKLSDCCVAEIKDDMTEHMSDSGESYCIGDIVKTKKPLLRAAKWIYGQYNPNTPPIGTIVQRRIVNAEVTWLERRIGSHTDEEEPNQMIDRLDVESERFKVYDRTRRPQGNAAYAGFGTVSNSEIDARINLRVRFKDLSGACVKYDGSSGHGKVNRIDRRDCLGYDLNVFDIVKFQTDVTVQWQDTSITHERSIDVIPDTVIDDEHAAWPGEIVHSPELQVVPELPGVKQATKVGVVQSVNAFERMAKVQWCPSACVQYSVDLMDSPGLRSALTSAVGRTAGAQDEVSLYDVEAPGELNVRRGDIVLIANPGSKPVSASGSEKDFDWLGEIVDTCLDGSLTVRLGAAKQVQDINIAREDVVVAVRSDGTDLGDAWGDENNDPYMRVNSDGELEYMDDSGSEIDVDEDEESEDSEEDEEEEENVRYEDENGEPLDEEDVENEDWESDTDEDEDVAMLDAPNMTPPTSQSATPPDTARRKEGLDRINEVKVEMTESPKTYLILDTPVPSSHHSSSEPGTELPAHLKRIQKEHKVLRTPGNLPNGVYVRTWESRLDLLRVLFIGPADTPYADAPFVVDFFLPPTFPAEPPQAFFHSWPAEGGVGGVGRVNPNLYEDGKICLSLLGTWDSEKSAGWNAGKSTLLQVLVSLLGLVLVREPYFNEAGYEPLVGLESSRRSSELYSERVFLKARTFVISALKKLRSEDSGGTAGVEGLESVLEWTYRNPSGPMLLEKVVREVEEVLERSEPGGNKPKAEQGLIMSKGACIPLRRVLERLREL